jgi:hypothetical protein
MAAIMIPRPVRAKRVSDNTAPMTASTIRKLVGSSSTPTVLDRMKNRRTSHEIC